MWRVVGGLCCGRVMLWVCLVVVWCVIGVATIVVIYYVCYYYWLLSVSEFVFVCRLSMLLVVIHLGELMELKG